MQRLLLLSVGFCLALVAPLSAQESDAKAILEKALKAHGNEKAALKITATTAKAKGTIHIMGMDVDFNLESWSQLPDKTKSIINLTIDGNAVVITQVFNGKKGWINFAGSVMDLEQDQIKEALEQLYVDRVTGLYGIKADKEIKLSPLGETKVGDKAVVGLQVTKKGKRDVNLYFDKKTNLLVKSESRAIDPTSKEEVTQEKLILSYRDVAGIKSAGKMAVLHDGKPYMELEITEAAVVERHDDSIFARPD